MEKYLDLRNDKDYSKLKESAEIIKNGGIVIFPTETVYGIGANGLNENSIKKLYNIKQRDLDKPICLLVSNMDMIKNITKDITEVEYKIMENFFPGPITIILKKKNIVPNMLTANKDTVGIRIPECEITRKLIEYANIPIATTSANISGEKSGTNIDEIMKVFNGKVDYFINGGESTLGIASTIVKVINEVPYILRQGTITKQQIEKVLNKKD